MFKLKNRIYTLFLCVICLTFSSFSSAEDFVLPNKGTLNIQVPSNWQSQFKQPPGELPPTIRLTDNNSLLLITPLWSPTGDEAFNSDRNVRKLVEDDGNQMISTAIEKELKIFRINTENINGYYFQLTDKNPKPGEFKYVCRSGIRAGEFLLSVTYLSHNNDISNFLEIMQSVKHNQKAL